MCNILKIREVGPKTINEIWADAYHVWLHWGQDCCKQEQSEMKISNPEKYKAWEDIMNSMNNDVKVLKDGV